MARVSRLACLFVFLWCSCGCLLMAEPWLSNRFAQNCAGCHAPGRKNVGFMDRRCTLSCQGCHINPNGGGIRNEYGKWNQERWLRSFNGGVNRWLSPAPSSQQKYGTADKSVAADSKIPTSNSVRRDAAANRRELNATREKAAVLVTVPDYVDGDLYDRRDGLEFVTSSDRLEFLRQIPKGDPLRETAVRDIDAGLDLRWQTVRGEAQYSDKKGVQPKRKIWQSMLMVADLSLLYRPFAGSASVVYEGRYLGNPDSKNTRDVGATLQRRSLYVLVDDVALNSFAMAGFYRPMFGNYNPDHTHLTQKLLGVALHESPSTYNLNYQAATLGTAPNIPFLNVHLISQQLGQELNETNKGIAVNLGGRFVRFSLSPQYSYWTSAKKVEVAGELVDTKLQMHSFTLGTQVGPLTMNVEGLMIIKDVPNDAYLKSQALSGDFYFQLWREVYATTSLTSASTAVDLKPGSANQVRFGLRMFVIPGVDLMLYSSSDREERTEDTDREPSDAKADTLNAQMHMYF